MADFHLWSKENLVKFAEEITARLAAQETAIEELTLQVQAVHKSWRLALALAVPSATLDPQQPKGAPLEA